VNFLLNLPAIVASPILPCAGLAAALLLSLFLLRLSTKGGSLPGCGPDSPCDQVTKGRWSRIGPIPVSLLGSLNYLALLIAVVVPPRPWPIILALVILTLASAAWFMLLQLAVIRRLCLYCTAAHVCALAGCLLILHQAQTAHIPPLQAQQATLFGGLLAGLLIISQLLFRPRMYAVTVPAVEEGSRVSGLGFREEGPEWVPAPPATPSPEIQTSIPAAATSSPNPTPETQTPPPPPALNPKPQTLDPLPSPPNRRIQVMRNQISLSQHLWPVLGARDAQTVLVDLLDYTCHDCRHMHSLLEQAIRHYSGKLAVIPMPVPMNPACNPHVRGLNPHHLHACPLARAALAVWRANPAKFDEFDHWLYDREKSYTGEEAQAKARELVGSEELARALEDPWLSKRMNEAIAIYAAVGTGRIPNLLMPQAMIQGVVPDLAELIKILDQQMQLQSAAPT
jgi:uncharacterized membrane protein